MGSELLLFAKSLWYGILMTAGYDLFRILRRIIRHGPGWVIMEDLCYWIGSGFFLFSRIYLENSGILRGYFFVGVVLGMIFWHYTISGYLIGFAVMIAGATKKATSFFIKRLKFLVLRCKISICKLFCRFFRKS